MEQLDLMHKAVKKQKEEQREAQAAMAAEELQEPEPPPSSEGVPEGEEVNNEVDHLGSQDGQ